MKRKLFLFLLIISTSVCAQDSKEQDYKDTLLFEINENQLKLNINEIWKIFDIVEIDDIGGLEFESTPLTFQPSNIHALMISWSNSLYGSGGGLIVRGIKIWNIKNGELLLDEITSCSNESFGRFDSDRYLVSCRKEIQVTDSLIKVSRIYCEEDWFNQGFEYPNEYCNFSNLESGTYIINDKGELKSKPSNASKN